MKKLIFPAIFLFTFPVLGQELTLQWTNSDTPEVTGYNLYRSLSEGGPYTKVNPEIIPEDSSGKTEFTDTTVQLWKRYFWVCRAVVEYSDPYLGDELQIKESVDSNEATDLLTIDVLPATGLIKKY
jgi:hypothetical protein